MVCCAACLGEGLPPEPVDVLPWVLVVGAWRRVVLRSRSIPSLE